MTLVLAYQLPILMKICLLIFLIEFMLNIGPQGSVQMYMYNSKSLYIVSQY